MKKNINWKKHNDEVYYSQGNDEFVRFSKDSTDYLCELGDQNKRKRSRFCAHSDINDIVHEMIIYHKKDTYVRPHKHKRKSESLHLIKGKIDLVLFHDDGKVAKVFRMGNYESQDLFYYRMPESLFHTMIIREDSLFHEVTIGPFKKSHTIWAPWAPDESNKKLVTDYTQRLKSKIKLYEIQ